VTTTLHDKNPEEPIFPLYAAIAFIATEQKDPLCLEQKIHDAFNPVTFHIRAKTTTATQLAQGSQAKKPLEEVIPDAFLKYQQIFSEQATQRLPKHQPWDHAIELKPNSTWKDCGIYRLTPSELQALKEFLDEHLR